MNDKSYMHYHIAAAAKSLTKGLALDFHLFRLSSHLATYSSSAQLQIIKITLINEVQSRDKQLTPRDHTRASIRSIVMAKAFGRQLSKVKKCCFVRQYFCDISLPSYILGFWSRGSTMVPHRPWQKGRKESEE